MSGLVGIKQCARCKRKYPLSHFHNYKNGKYTYCKPCAKESLKEYKTKHPRGRFKTVLRQTYNLTVEQYDELIRQQNNSCAICKRDFADMPRSPNIDHDHSCCSGVGSCGECIRGLLCTRCNSAVEWYITNSASVKEYLNVL